MELGTGVFLSAIFLGFVALFIATKDRWNWKKIAFWQLGGLVALLAAGGVIAYGYTLYDERPQVPSEFQGIQLGQRLDDAEFKRGKAEKGSELLERIIEARKDEVTTSDHEELDELVAALKDAREEEARAVSTKSRDGEYWFGGTRVTIKDNLVASIFQSCVPEFGGSMTVNQIGCGNTGDEILSKFGGDVRILCEIKKDNGSSPTRVYDVLKYGTRYYLTTNLVEAIMIATPSTLESYVGINWDRCGP